MERIVTKGGRRFACDFAVVGLGIEPVTELVDGTRVKVDNGIVVDEYCRTKVEGIYAAGDVANLFHPVFGRQVRVEHWQNAINQGAAGANSMLGTGAPCNEIHWFWSDQYDAIQYAGFHTSWDELVVRGNLVERNSVVFYLNDGIGDAAVALNRGKDLRSTIPLIKARAPVAPAIRQHEDVDLKSSRRALGGHAKWGRGADAAACQFGLAACARRLAHCGAGDRPREIRSQHMMDLFGPHGGSRPMPIALRRAYEEPGPEDGYRVLVDRLWPRGVSKEEAKLDEWMKQVAPSDQLREWFDHDPSRWGEFRRRYLSELKTHRDDMRALAQRAESLSVTLVFGASDREHNNAVVVGQYLKMLGAG